MLAADVGLGEILWTVLVVFFMFAYLLILFQILGDLFRDSTTSGVSKALWVLLLFIFPLLGPLLYLIMRGRSMNERQMKAAVETKQQMDDYIRQTAGGGAATEIAQAKQLLDSGAISQEEFDALKRKALG